ncbi:MAG: hypothetical protein KAH96_06510 [Alphaproteobacteria bacterium]|nr:hypothetical protein [Alphaproteobacteria bacterium]
MSEANLTLVFDGSALQSNEMDVKDLGQALIAMGDLIQAANAEINGSSAQIEVKVKAHRAGSFEVDFLVHALEVVKPLLDVAKQHQEDISAANDLLELLFKIGGVTWGGVKVAQTATGGVIAFLKWLKGRRIPEKIERQSNGDVHIHIGENYFVTNDNTVKLTKSIAVRKPVKELISALKQKGVDALKIKRTSKTDLEVTKSEVGYFDYSDEEELVESTRKMNLQIVKLSFKECDKWQMTDGGKPFNVTIEDVDFLNRVQKREVAFANGDYLECDVLEKQYRTSSGLKMQYTITQVHNHMPATQQLRLI